MFRFQFVSFKLYSSELVVTSFAIVCQQFFYELNLGITLDHLFEALKLFIHDTSLGIRILWK